MALVVDSVIDARVPEDADSVTSLIVTLDGMHAVSGHESGKIRVWSLAQPSLVKTLEGHTDEVKSLATIPRLPQIFLSGSADGTARTWRLDRDTSDVMSGHMNTISAIVPVTGAAVAVTASEDGTARLWNVFTGECLRVLEAPAPVMSAAALPDGSSVVTGSFDGTLQAWGTDGSLRLERHGHRSAIFCIAALPDNRRVITCPCGPVDNPSSDCSPLIWDLTGGGPPIALSKHTGGIYSLALIGDGGRAVTGSWDHTACVWDTTSGRCKQWLLGHSNVIRDFAVTETADSLFSCAQDGEIIQWSLSSGRPVRSIRTETEASVDCLAVTPRDRWLVVGDGYGYVYRLSLAAADLEFRPNRAFPPSKPTTWWTQL